MSRRTQTCFRIKNGLTTTHPNATLCPSSSAGGPETCCTGDDICLPDGLCELAETPANGGSGFYLAYCSDDSFGPPCNKHCGKPPAPQGPPPPLWPALTRALGADTAGVPDVVFNSTTSLWACCSGSSDGDVNFPLCSQPLNETFQAAAPVSLIAQAAAATSAIATSASSVASTSAASSAATTSAPSSTPSSDADTGGLSTGSKVGIGVGVGLGGLMLILAVSFFLSRYWRREDNFKSSRESLGRPPPEAGAAEMRTASPRAQLHSMDRKPEIQGTQRLEMSDASRVHEISNQSPQRTHELASSPTESRSDCYV